MYQRIMLWSVVFYHITLCSMAFFQQRVCALLVRPWNADDGAWNIRALVAALDATLPGILHYGEVEGKRGKS